MNRPTVRVRCAGDLSIGIGAVDVWIDPDLHRAIESDAAEFRMSQSDYLLAALDRACSAMAVGRRDLSDPAMARRRDRVEFAAWLIAMDRSDFVRFVLYACAFPTGVGAVAKSAIPFDHQSGHPSRFAPAGVSPVAAVGESTRRADTRTVPRPRKPVKVDP